MTTTQKLRGKVFNAEDMLAIRAKTKTQFREVIDPQPTKFSENGKAWRWRRSDGKRLIGSRRSVRGIVAGSLETLLDAIVDYCPHGNPGERYWLKETWGLVCDGGYAVEPSTLTYRADGAQRIVHPDELMRSDGSLCVPRKGWRPASQMPCKLSRTMIEVTEVRAERLHAIMPDDAIAEGAMTVPQDSTIDDDLLEDPRERFRMLWNSRNAKRGHGWERNDHVWVRTFEVVA